MAVKKTYEDDDGRTIVDMSEVDPMPVLLPRRLVDAWIDPGCSPDERLRCAVLDVRGRRVDAPAPEQLRMEL